MEEKLFREKSIERLSTPEDLSDYLKVTSPGIWMVLAAVIALIFGVMVWAAMANLETTLPVRVEVKDNSATVYVTGEDVGKIKQGMILRTEHDKARIESVEEDEYGRLIVKAVMNAKNGIYNGDIVTESVTPISFLIKKK